jgi:hypothetical protein
MPSDYEFHEAADIFPLDEEEIDALAQDIRDNGLTFPIQLLDGKVLDGRRRLLACRRAGVAPRFEEVKPPDVVTHVLSLNLHRRHLKQGQKSVCAAKAKVLREKLEAEGKKQMSVGGKAAGGGRPKQGFANQRNPVPGTVRTSQTLGELFGVGARTVDDAVKVVKNAIPEVIEAVTQGRMAVALRHEEQQQDDVAGVVVVLVVNTTGRFHLRSSSAASGTRRLVPLAVV